MGTSKALLELEGRTLLERAVTAMREGGCATVLVVVGAGEAGQGVAERARAAGAVPVVNPRADAEQVESLRCALRALPDEAAAAVVTPVDVPGVEAGVVRALLAAFRRTGAPLVRPEHGGRHGHPVLFGRALFAELLQEELPDGARTVVRRHAGEAVDVETASPDVLLDLDTPADYRRHREGGR